MIATVLYFKVGTMPGRMLRVLARQQSGAWREWARKGPPQPDERLRVAPADKVPLRALWCRPRTPSGTEEIRILSFREVGGGQLLYFRECDYDNGIPLLILPETMEDRDVRSRASCPMSPRWGADGEDLPEPHEIEAPVLPLPSRGDGPPAP
jgi:hypothetical protein